MSETPSTNSGVPFEKKRELLATLSQETRHTIIQTLLGHPDNLASAGELHHMVGKSKKTVNDQLKVLVDEGIIAQFQHLPNKDRRGLPWQFYGFTQFGIDLLADFGYLSSVPMMRAIYEKTRKTDKVERHQQAPRPELPEVIQDALTSENSRGPADNVE